MKEPTIKPDQPPVAPATPILSYSPILFDAPGRIATMEVKVTAPAIGDKLPIILFSHGHGASNFLSSIRGYGPLIDFYAAHGFVVIQVTHQDSTTLALDASGPEGKLWWRTRAEDMRYLLDHLDDIEQAAPFLGGRLDKERVAAVGHSMGGQTVSMLLGQRIRDIHTGELVDLTEPRLKAAVVMGVPGDGKDAAPWLRENYPEILDNDFSTMTKPALVVNGGADFAANFSERKTWRSDAYTLSPAPKTMITFVDAEHIFGGISGWDALECSDEDPQRAADVQRATWAWLRSQLYPGDTSWEEVVRQLTTGEHAVANVESKQADRVLEHA